MTIKQNLTISDRLKFAREKKGYTALGFSKKLGIAFSTYYQHETGKRNINTNNAIMYCQELQITLSWLITGSEGN